MSNFDYFDKFVLKYSAIFCLIIKKKVWNPELRWAFDWIYGWL